MATKQSSKKRPLSHLCRSPLCSFKRGAAGVKGVVIHRAACRKHVPQQKCGAFLRHDGYALAVSASRQVRDRLPGCINGLRQWQRRLTTAVGLGIWMEGRAVDVVMQMCLAADTPYSNGLRSRCKCTKPKVHFGMVHLHAEDHLPCGLCMQRKMQHMDYAAEVHRSRCTMHKPHGRCTKPTVLFAADAPRRLAKRTTSKTYLGIPERYINTVAVRSNLLLDRMSLSCQHFCVIQHESPLSARKIEKEDLTHWELG